MKILIAGANGHLGRRFIESFGSEHDLIALVRSPAAAEVLFALPCQVAIVAYGDVQQMSRLADGAEVLINLTGSSRRPSQILTKKPTKKPPRLWWPPVSAPGFRGF